ncbi:hypothetical protein LAJ19_08785 [Deinococcus taeanensis]|uniref:hypothetical protein n=1 Tax=Deinococcus taeanensis TaxID=2737050 RepID=UPI001CDB8E26|nr:hypothetical protein [Deinococcus taeanensis]UBV41747.1 hypothetical protein LAJ19_08785 [Deinococcus taeanensis]
MLALVGWVHRALLDRGGLTPGELADGLEALTRQVEALPFDVDWPEPLPREEASGLRARVAGVWSEVGWYDPATGRGLSPCALPEEIGDALDDLSNLALDLGTAVALAETDARAALSWLRWSHDTHWADHARVTRHLRWLG